MTNKPKMMGLIFANTHDEQVNELTQKRCMAAIPFGGRYRLVDFALSNMSNAEISRVGIIARSNYMSLMHHVESGKSYDLARKNGGLFVLPPNVAGAESLYHGHLQAISDIFDFLDMAPEDYVVLADADVIANVNLNEMFHEHLKNHADVTVAYQNGLPPVGHGDTMSFEWNADGRVAQVNLAPDTDTACDYSLDIAIFNKKHLMSLAKEATDEHLKSISKDIYQRLRQSLAIYGYRVHGYTAVIDSLQSYYRANMELLCSDVRHSLFSSERPIMTKVQDEPPVVYGLNAKVTNSLIADGCIIDGTVENSVVSRNVKIAKGAVVRNSVIMSECTIESGAALNHVCTDRLVTIAANTEQSGTESCAVFIPQEA